MYLYRDASSELGSVMCVPVSERDRSHRGAGPPERQAQGKGKGERTVLGREVGFEVTMLAGCQPSFQNKTFSSAHKVT